MSLFPPDTYRVTDEVENWLERWPGARTSLHAMLFSLGLDPHETRRAEKDAGTELDRRLWHDFSRSDCVFDPGFVSRSHTQCAGRGLAIGWGLGWRDGERPERVHGLGVDVEFSMRKTPPGLIQRIRMPGEVDHGILPVPVWTIKEAMLKADRGTLNPLISGYRILHYDPAEGTGTGQSHAEGRRFYFRVVEDMGWTLAFCVAENRQ